MNAIQQRCRPKHQVLVLKCYPRTTKGMIDVKPNSSELSYLLFYATSRRSKIQKVGSFLEKKTASDVWRLRIGNVQVTLQILAALIEKSPKDMPLFAPYVLKILDLVLRSDDMTMVQSSLPTFATFCENHDASSLQADQAYVQQYESVVRAYATLASTRHSPGRIAPTKPVAMRWRNTGLEAIKSVASSDALTAASALQLDRIIPMILENLWTDNEDFLDVLLHRAQSDEKDRLDPEKGLVRRRTSIATVRTAETTGDTNPIALSGSAVDVDKLAEEDIGVLAMQCLKQVFVVPNRPQIHGATTALLKFIEERVLQDEVLVKRNPHTGHDHGWAIKVIGLIARWAPVQDRYVILVTIMEAMHKMPLNDETIQQHVVPAAMAGSLLRSDINLIGLSVMDVLLGFITQMRKVINLPGSRLDLSDHSSGEDNNEPAASESNLVGAAVAQRKELLNRLQQCVGEMATHVYYIDQISDMIATILARLRPAPSGSTANSSPAGERAEPALGAGMGSSPNLTDSQQLEAYFTLTVGKISALKAIKAILSVANPSTTMSGNVNLLRNRVPVSVWDGTEWMLRDPDGFVRRAYVDALITWLDREMTINDLRARDDGYPNRTTAMKNGAKELAPAAVARRAASSASAREKKPAHSHSHFLQLIHLAIYDNALQFIEFESDILLLHILLTKLTMQFGVNSVRNGLPMIFRLQEDIQDAETPIAKVRIGSLCHGFFWVLTERFDFESSVVGRAIHNEVVRRRSKGFWVDGIQLPPPHINAIGIPGTVKPPAKLPMREIESESLLPFDDRNSLVECIATGYQEHTLSPPTSPAASPGRPPTHHSPGIITTAPTIDQEQDLPSRMREEMLILDWTRESVILSIQEASKSASLNGSRSGTTTTNRNLHPINVANAANGHNIPGPPSPVHSGRHRPLSRQAVDGVAGIQGSRLRNASVKSNISHSHGSASSRNYVTSIEQLKLVLAGAQVQPPALSQGDDSSESMASYDFTASEMSFNQSQTDQGDVVSPAELARQGTSSSRKVSGSEAALGPLNSNPTMSEAGRVVLQEGNGNSNGSMPPMPPLPRGVQHPTKKVMVRTNVPQVQIQDGHEAVRSGRRSIKSRGGDGGPVGIGGLPPKSGHGEVTTTAVPVLDLDALLKGIDSRAGEGTTLGGVTKPPY